MSKKPKWAYDCYLAGDNTSYLSGSGLMSIDAVLASVRHQLEASEELRADNPCVRVVITRTEPKASE